MPKLNSMGYSTKAKLIALPAFAGFFVFYVVPFVWSLQYSVIKNNFKKDFVGLANFEKVLQNEYYLLALKNTLIFSVIGVIGIVFFSLVVSIFFISAGKQYRFLRITYILPMLLPTAGTALVFRNVFNRFGQLTAIQVEDPGFLLQLFPAQLIPLYLIFIWKFCGLNIILITGAIGGIDNAIYEAAMLDGAKGFKLHAAITAPLIRPILFFTTVLSIVNSFKIYKEIFYLFGGDYPPDAVYLLQHFMNNNFRKLNYQNLSAGACIFTAIILCIVFIFYVSSRGAGNGGD